MKLVKAISSTSVVLLAACSGPSGLDDGRHPTGSQTIATSSDYSALYVADADQGFVTRLGVDSRAPVTLELPGEPTRVARAGDRVFVTLRAARQLAVLIDRGDRLELETTVELGTEPYGVVASEDGKRVYVAASTANRVHELDAQTLSVVRAFQVEDEPRWLALHPSGKLYAASAFKGTFSVIDLDSGKVHKTSLPSSESFNHNTGEPVQLSRRITGDLAVTPNGRAVLIPTLYLDTTTPITEPGDDKPDGERPFEEPGGGYSADRFNPVIAVAEVDGSGMPDLEDAALVRINGFTRFEPVNGYPAAVAISPDSEITFVGLEGASAIIAFPTFQSEEAKSTDIFSGFFGGIGRDEAIFGPGNFQFRNMVTIESQAGPRGMAFISDERGFVYSFLDRSVQSFSIPLARTMLGMDQEDGFDGPRFDGTPVSTGNRVELFADRLSPELSMGRKLFYSANDSRMSQSGSGVSCATCHFEGRNDGLTWAFDAGLRQTPSLAGRVSLTEPVRWEGDRATVAEDARRTSQGLMGGNGITDNDIEAIAAFVDWTRDVDLPLKSMRNDQIRRGEAIFNREDVACGSCHSGARLTDNKSYSMLGMSTVQTRSLVGIAATAPYFHDGSAATLRDVLIRARTGAMGNTSALSDAEMSDLEVFLQSL